MSTTVRVVACINSPSDADYGVHLVCSFRLLGCDPGRVAGAQVSRATRHVSAVRAEVQSVFGPLPIATHRHVQSFLGGSTVRAEGE